MQSAPQSIAQSDDRKPWQFKPGQSGLPQGRYALAKERARLEEEERRVEAAALAGDLGHPPTAMERLLIEQASSLAVEARRLRRLGKSSADEVRLLSRILGQLGLGKPAEAPVETYAELSKRIAAEAGARRAQELAEDEAQAVDDITSADGAP
jgi:hypothetical protein